MSFDGRTARRLDGAPAHPARPAAHAFSCRGRSRAFRLLDNMRIPLLYTVAAAQRRRSLRRDCRGALRRSAARGRPRRQGATAAARSDPGRNAQARARARHGGRAEAPDRRRIDGWPHAIPRSTKSSRCCMRLNGQGVTVILIEHIMRAVMSFSQRLVVLVFRPARSPTATRRRWCASPKSRRPTLASSLTIAGMHAGYGAVRVLEDVSLDSRRRRDRGTARHQRQRQNRP